MSRLRRGPAPSSRATSTDCNNTRRYGISTLAQSVGQGRALKILKGPKTPPTIDTIVPRTVLYCTRFRVFNSLEVFFRCDDAQFMEARHRCQFLCKGCLFCPSIIRELERRVVVDIHQAEYSHGLVSLIVVIAAIRLLLLKFYCR